MSKKQTGKEQVNKSIDVFWDSWFEGVKKFNDLQRNFEEQSFKALNNFDELIKPTTDMLKKAEEESARLTKETNEKLQAGFESFTKENVSAMQQNFLKQVEEVNNHTQNLFWSSNKALVDFVSTSQKKMAENIESLLEEQQKGRQEIVEKLADLVDEIKDAQKSTVTAK